MPQNPPAVQYFRRGGYTQKVFQHGPLTEVDEMILTVPAERPSFDQLPGAQVISGEES